MVPLVLLGLSTTSQAELQVPAAQLVFGIKTHILGDPIDEIISIDTSVESSQKVPTATPNDSNTTSQPSKHRTSGSASNDALARFGLPTSPRKKKE